MPHSSPAPSSFIKLGQMGKLTYPGYSCSVGFAVVTLLMYAAFILVAISIFGPWSVYTLQNSNDTISRSLLQQWSDVELLTGSLYKTNEASGYETTTLSILCFTEVLLLTGLICSCVISCHCFPICSPTFAMLLVSLLAVILLVAGLIVYTVVMMEEPRELPYTDPRLGWGLFVIAAAIGVLIIEQIIGFAIFCKRGDLVERKWINKIVPTSKSFFGEFISSRRSTKVATTADKTVKNENNTSSKKNTSVSKTLNNRPGTPLPPPSGEGSEKTAKSIVSSIPSVHSEGMASIQEEDVIEEIYHKISKGGGGSHRKLSKAEAAEVLQRLKTMTAEGAAEAKSKRNSIFSKTSKKSKTSGQGETVSEKRKSFAGSRKSSSNTHVINKEPSTKKSHKNTAPSVIIEEEDATSREETGKQPNIASSTAYDAVSTVAETVVIEEPVEGECGTDGHPRRARLCVSLDLV